MMDTNIDTDGTAFICPECSFNGTSLPELISHMNDAHSEGLMKANRNLSFLSVVFLETATRSEAPVQNSSLHSSEKRSRRKPAFSHQVNLRFSKVSFAFNKFFSSSMSSRLYLKRHGHLCQFLNRIMSIQVRFISGIEL